MRCAHKIGNDLYEYYLGKMFGNSAIYTYKEATEELQIARNAIYKLLPSGQLKGFKVGRNWKIAKKAIDAYIDEQISKI